MTEPTDYNDIAYSKELAERNMYKGESSVYRDPGQVAEGNIGIDEFTDKILELTSLAWGEDWGTFTLEEPVGNDQENLNAPIITYDIHERVRSESHKSLDPILFDTVKDPDDPGASIKLYRMWFDVEMEFKIYHETNREARMLMEEFETFLFTYKGFFKNMGISDIIFLAETKPMVTTLWQQNLPTRTLRYLVRIERITTIRSSALQKATSVRIDTEQLKKATAQREDSLISNYRGQQRIRD